ncbi:Protein bride of sevenless [Trichinella spiralis]|uniref:Protein bride of sevenless n=1 Tax=Trichinella spiralis TaxID=6334 RepID=A0ABR3KRF6_TRISP
MVAFPLNELLYRYLNANRRNAIATCICNFYLYQVISLILRRVACESESSILELVEELFCSTVHLYYIYNTVHQIFW